MRSHFIPDPRVMLACAAGATTMLTGIAEAAPIAADYATNSAYADGWQATDNGGYGFTAWSFYGTYNSAAQHAMDNASPHNQLGLAWTIYLPYGSIPDPPQVNSPNPPENPPQGAGDLSRAGRGFAPLQIGQTISVVIDNPEERTFYKGYTIALISGGANNGYCCPGSISRLRVGTFEYGTFGRWYAAGADGDGGGTSLFDTNTAGGLQLDVKLTGPNNYSLTMTPLANPGNAYTQSGTLKAGGPIDWIMFEHYNTDSDFYNPAGPAVAVNPRATDFYISSLEINPATGGNAPLVSARPAPNAAGKNPPSGKQTAANPDGFFQLLAEDESDPNPNIYIADSASSFVAGPFANGDLVKITSNSGAEPNQKPGGGVTAHITLTGTALIYATDSDGNSSTPVPIL